MSKIRWLVIPVLFLSLLGCSLISGIQQAGSQLPAMLTSMPTALEAMGTMAAGQGAAANATPAAGRLNISIAAAESALQSSGQFSFSDSTEGGQPVATAVLTTTFGHSFPTVANGFSARFIGDPANLSRIQATIPRSDDPATAQQGVGIIEALFSGLLPPDVNTTFVPWVIQNYPLVPVSGEQQTTIKNLQFTLRRSTTDMTFEIDPAP